MAGRKYQVRRSPYTGAIHEMKTTSRGVVSLYWPSTSEKANISIYERGNGVLDRVLSPAEAGTVLLAIRGRI